MTGETFGGALRRMRTERSLSQRDLARLAHIDKTHISKLENGRRRPPAPAILNALDQALGARGHLIYLASRDKPTDVGASAIAIDSESMRRRTVLADLAALAAGVGFMSAPGPLLWASAHIATRLSANADTAIGPLTLDHMRSDLHALGTDYVRTSDVPNVLGRLLILYEQLTRQIDPAPPARSASELYLMTSATCILLASISHDLGESDAAMMHAQSATVFADLARSRPLLVWATCTKAMIDLWRRRPLDALRHIEHVDASEIRGAAGRRLGGLKVRSLALLGRVDEARTLMESAFDSDLASDAPTISDLGAAFSFPATRQHYYAAVNSAYLGDHAAVERSVAALGHGNVAPPEHSGWPISWALSRTYLAMARLDHRGTEGGPEAALEALTPVLKLPMVQRINQVTQLLADIDARLGSPSFRGNHASQALRSALRDFRPSRPAIAS